MNTKEERNYLISHLEKLTKKGYRCYICTDDNYAYGEIITPNDNVLGVQHEYFGGYTFSLQYKSTSKNGSGCRCLKEPVNEITEEIINQAELEGLSFARSLNAQLYKNSEEWYSNLIYPSLIIEV